MAPTRHATVPFLHQLQQLNQGFRLHNSSRDCYIMHTSSVTKLSRCCTYLRSFNGCDCFDALNIAPQSLQSLYTRPLFMQLPIPPWPTQRCGLEAGSYVSSFLIHLVALNDKTIHKINLGRRKLSTVINEPSTDTQSQWLVTSCTICSTYRNYILSTYRICVFHVHLRTNSDYFPVQYWFGFYSGEKSACYTVRTQCSNIIHVNFRL